MNKYICVGAHVTRKGEDIVGKVISINREIGVAVMRTGEKIWADKTQNLEVTSYKEVE